MSQSLILVPALLPSHIFFVTIPHSTLARRYEFRMSINNDETMKGDDNLLNPDCEQHSQFHYIITFLVRTFLALMGLLFDYCFSSRISFHASASLCSASMISQATFITETKLSHEVIHLGFECQRKEEEQETWATSLICSWSCTYWVITDPWHSSMALPVTFHIWQVMLRLQKCIYHVVSYSVNKPPLSWHRVRLIYSSHFRFKTFRAKVHHIALLLAYGNSSFPLLLSHPASSNSMPHRCK